MSGAKKDYYSTLGVGFEASEAQLRAAYLKLALKWHPDKHEGDAAANEKFKEISEAYHVLSDAKLRAHYDEATEYDIKTLAVEEYLARFKSLILTVNGLGMGADCAIAEKATLAIAAAAVPTH